MPFISVHMKVVPFPFAEFAIKLNIFQERKLRFYQTTLPDSWEIWMQVKKQQLEPDMEQ